MEPQTRVGTASPVAFAAPEPPPVARRGPAWTAAALLLTTAMVMVARHPALPTAQFLRQHVSTDSLPPGLADHADEVLLVPFAAVLVVFFQLTLGIRMLGPFRPILLAVAFEFTGYLVGVTFMAGVFAVIAAMRPRLTNVALPYASRLSIILITVVFLQVGILLLANALDWREVGKTAFFPIIVLCLAADGFARALADEGPRSALWKGATTIVTALVISLLYQVPLVVDLLLAFPELMMAEVACILLISAFLGQGLLQQLNPVPRPKPEVLLTP